jgi:hypothetical protein
MGPVATPQVTTQCLTLGAGGDKGSRGVMARCLRLQNGYTLEANGRPGNNIIEFRATTYSASEQPRDLPAVLGRPPPLLYTIPYGPRTCRDRTPSKK